MSNLSMYSSTSTTTHTPLFQISIIRIPRCPVWVSESSKFLNAKNLSSFYGSSTVPDRYFGSFTVASTQTLKSGYDIMDQSPRDKPHSWIPASIIIIITQMISYLLYHTVSYHPPFDLFFSSPPPQKPQIRLQSGENRLNSQKTKPANSTKWSPS